MDDNTCPSIIPAYLRWIHVALVCSLLFPLLVVASMFMDRGLLPDPAYGWGGMLLIGALGAYLILRFWKTTERAVALLEGEAAKQAAFLEQVPDRWLSLGVGASA